MTAADYAAARRERGTQQAIADALGVHRMTIVKREAALHTVSREAKIALLSLPKLKKPL